MKLAVLASLLALAVTAVPPRAARADQLATKPCADPELPRAILDGQPAAPGPTELRTIDVSVRAGTLRLAVADTQKRREIGLMCVTALRPKAGMIFVFASAAEQDFWMKKTLVPLDMLWLDADGRVATIAADVPPSTLDEPDDLVARRFGSGRYVVELRAGEARRLGIAVGDRLTLPALNARD